MRFVAHAWIERLSCCSWEEKNYYLKSCCFHSDVSNSQDTCPSAVNSCIRKLNNLIYQTLSDIFAVAYSLTFAPKCIDQYWVKEGTNSTSYVLAGWGPLSHSPRILAVVSRRSIWQTKALVVRSSRNSGIAYCIWETLSPFTSFDSCVWLLISWVHSISTTEAYSTHTRFYLDIQNMKLCATFGFRRFCSLQYNLDLI